MKPTIGRIVHFLDVSGFTRAAIVTKIYPENRVDLTVFYPKNERPIYADVDVANIPFGDYPMSWSWPPR